MRMREIDDGIYVSGQISTADLPDLAREGIRTLICNRPDGEAEEQPDFTLIQQAATEHGIDAHYVPVTPAGITEDNLSAIITLLDTSERPLLAYCRTGNRSDTICRLAKNAVRKNNIV